MSEDFKKKQKELQKLLGSIAKKDDGVQVSTGAQDVVLEETGVWAIDRLVRGVPRGQYTHIYGPPGVGKTSTMYSMIGSMQKKGMVCTVIPNERRYNAEWAKQLGVDVDALNLVSTKTLEQCLDVIIAIAKSGACDLIAVDTITGVASLGEIENKKGSLSVGDDQMALKN